MNYLETRYSIPSRKHISTQLKYKHSLFIETLKEKLDKEAENIMLTTDIWISAATEAYITAVKLFSEYSSDVCQFKKNGSPEIKRRWNFNL